jgi:hypothetical protein
VSPAFLSLLKLAKHCVPQLCDLTPFIAKFATACEEFPLEAVGFLFTVFECAPPIAGDMKLIEFIESMFSIAIPLAVSFVRNGAIEQSLDLWYAIADYAPIFFTDPNLEFAPYFMREFCGCASLFPPDAKVFHEVISVLGCLLAQSSLEAEKNALFSLILAVADHSWSGDLEIAVRDLSESIADGIIAILQERLSEHVTPAVFPIISLFPQADPSLLRALCLAVIEFSDRIPLSHKISFLSRIGIAFPEFFEHWFQIAADNLCCIESVQFLTALIQASPEIRLLISPDIMNSVSQLFCYNHPLPVLTARRFFLAISPSECLPVQISARIEEFTSRARNEFTLDNLDPDPETLLSLLEYIHPTFSLTSSQHDFCLTISSSQI